MILLCGQGSVKEDDAAQVALGDISGHGMGHINAVAPKSNEKKLSDFLFKIHEVSVVFACQSGAVKE